LAALRGFDLDLLLVLLLALGAEVLFDFAGAVGCLAAVLLEDFFGLAGFLLASVLHYD